MDQKLSESIKSPIVVIGLIIMLIITALQLVPFVIVFLLEVPFGVVFTFIIKNHFLQQYSHHRLLSIDCILNSVMFGDPNESCSSRAGRLWPNSWWCKAINFMVFWELNHCQTHVETFAGKTDMIEPDPTKII